MTETPSGAPQSSEPSDPRPDEALRPGAGAPLVPGPPRSVRGPARAGRLNALLGTAGLFTIIAIVAVVVVVIILIVKLLTR